MTNKLYITAKDARKMTDETIAVQEAEFKKSFEDRMQTIYQEIETQAKLGRDRIIVRFADIETTLMHQIKSQLSNIGYKISDDGFLKVKVSW